MSIKNDIEVKKRKEVKDLSKMERVKMIKARLTQHCLTAQWLVSHLYSEYGVEISPTGLSHILSGQRVVGEATERVIESAEKVLDRYEEHYKKEGA